MNKLRKVVLMFFLLLGLGCERDDVQEQREDSRVDETNESGTQGEGLGTGTGPSARPGLGQDDGTGTESGPEGY